MSKNQIRGTAAQLVAAGLTIDGHKVTASDISSMHRLGIARADGEAPKAASQRGRAATIYVIDANPKLEVKASVERPEALTLA